MRLHFYHKPSLLGRLIQGWSRSEWNHVSIEVKGLVYEAIGGRLFGSNGILMSPDPMSYHRKFKDKTIIDTIELEIPYQKEIEIRDFLNSQVGSAYDTRGTLSFVFRWMKGREHLYYCSELAMKCIGLVQSVEFPSEYTPGAVHGIAFYLSKDLKEE